ncbi:MAG: hypothetical protein ACK54A_01580 [Sphingobacteriales bacterium]
MHEGIKRNGITVLLLMPIVFIYCLHFFQHDESLKPTGFITAEHATYMVYAKQYSTGEASLFFRYPFQPDAASPRIFFQPQTLLLGYLWKWTNFSPGLLLTLFGILFAFLAIRTAYDIIQIVCRKYSGVMTLLFIWGGGVMTFVGAAFHLLTRGSGVDVWSDIFKFDPGLGWWCLYFGRALIYPLEAYYHFIFLLAILFVLKNKYQLAALCVVVLTFSHSYTSVELALLLLVWILLEKYYFTSAIRTHAGLNLLLASCIFTFIFYAILTVMPLYRQLFRMVSLDWGYKAWNFIPAYAYVWLLSAYVVRKPDLFQKAIATPVQRLFLTWGIVAFLLSVHNFAIHPIQPLHFTRGYVYAGFFMFALVNLSEHILSLLGKVWVCIVIAFVFCLDNIVWFGSKYPKNCIGAYLSTEDVELVQYFNNQETKYLIDNDAKDVDIALFLQLYTKQVTTLPHEFLTIRTSAGADDEKMRIQYLREYKLPILKLYRNVDSGFRKPPVFRNTKYTVIAADN